MKKLTIVLAVLLVIAVIAIGVLVGQRNTLTTDRNAIEAQLETLTKEKAANDEVIAAVQANLDTVSSEKETLQQQYDELMAKAEQVTALQEERDQALQELGALTDASNVLTADNQAAQQALAALQAEKEQAMQELATLQGNVEQLTLEKDAAVAASTDLTQKYEELSKQAEELELQSQSAVVSERESPEELAALKAEKEQALAELETLKQNVDQLAQQRDEAVKNAEEAAAKYEELSLQAASLSPGEDEQAASEALEALKAENELALKQLDELKQSVAALTQEKDAAVQSAEALSTQYEDLKATADALAMAVPTPAEPAAKATLVPMVTEEPAEAVAITIFHTNDVHSRVEGNDTDQIGYAKLATIVRDAERHGPVLLLDVGDTLHGMAFSNLEKGLSVVKLLNMLGYDAMEPGNHDFNYGFDRLKELEKEMAFPLVNANIMLENGENAFTPFALLDAGDKVVAVGGIANPQMTTAIHPEMIKALTFNDYDVLTDVIAQVDEKSDAIILLAHWGADDAYTPNSSVLAQIPGVDLVIDGHSHTLPDEIAQVADGALIVSTGDYLKNIGQVTLTILPDGSVTAESDPITFEEASAVMPDEEVKAFIDEIKVGQDEILNTVIGVTEVDLDGERETNRSGETNLGNLATDALRLYTEADLAFTNGGGIRKSIPAGDITQRDVVEVFPFGNSVVIIEVTGEQLLAAMEHGVRLYPETNGGFPQISGAKFVFDPAKEVGSRIVSMEVGGEPVDPVKTYTMATNDFTAAGGDGYEMLKNSPILQYRGTLDEAFTQHIVRLGVINVAAEGRITVAEAVEEPSTEPAPSEEVVAPTEVVPVEAPVSN